jgi:archaellum component FlaD/FlaE
MMNVNPEDYDLDELRQMAAGRQPSESSSHGPEAVDDTRTTRNGERSSSRQRDREQPAHRNASGGSPSPMRRRGPASDALRSNQLEQLFLHQSAMGAEEMTKPYLDSLPQKYAAERVIFDWLEFLVLKGGFKRTMDALRYYRTIDWITDDVEAALQDYLVGFTDDGSGGQYMDVDDHQLSLLYVARLASMN